MPIFGRHFKIDSEIGVRLTDGPAKFQEDTFYDIFSYTSQ